MNAEISKLLATYKQEHIIRHLDLITATERQTLLHDIEQIDFEQIANLYESYRSGLKAEKKKIFQEANALSFNQTEASARYRKSLYALGEDCLSQARVAIFLVAGGQGTRLGFKGPKGCYAISPVKGKSLFRMFAETIQALQRRYGRPLQW